MNRWHRTSTHGNRCRKCNKAADYAKTEASVNRADYGTYTLDLPDGKHTANVTRPATDTNN